MQEIYAVVTTFASDPLNPALEFIHAGWRTLAVLDACASSEFSIAFTTLFARPQNIAVPFFLKKGGKHWHNWVGAGNSCDAGVNKNIPEKMLLVVKP